MLDTKLSAIMSADLITLVPGDNMSRVDDLFRTNSMHHLPVVDEAGKVVGMVSKSDYLLYCDSLTLFKDEVKADMNRRIFDTILVQEMMTRQVATLKVTDSVGFAIRVFQENLFHAIPIVDDKDKLVGIVTTFDMLNYAFREPPLLLKD